MAIAPKGYTNLGKKIGGFPLYFRSQSNEFALLTAVATNSQVSEDSMRRFATVADAEQWVKEQQSSEKLDAIKAYAHSVSMKRLTTHYDLMAQCWIEDSPQRNERHYDLIKPDPEWEQQAQAIIEEYTRLTSQVRALELRWKEHFGAAPRVERPLIGVEKE